MKQSSFYQDYFGLRDRPFTLVPDPEFLFWSPQHRRAYSVLEFGVLSRAPITLLTGEIGTGKTTLLHNLLSQLEDDVIVGLVSNAQGNRGELLQWVLNALDVPFETDATYVQNFQRLQDFLIDQYAQGKRVVLVFDEAQNISREGLEELRMLTNINSNKDELVQLILVGQPELRDMVRHPSMNQLAQRVSASFHLNRMTPDLTMKYIEHRLKAAGGSGKEFTPDACLLVHDITGGVPRLINQLCDFALLYSWTEETGRTVTSCMVQSVVDDGVFFCQRAVEREAQA
ncbi:ExeA family protein [Sedimentitalea arenosa]|jgi:type II secretory pathway predicted ATPase ExeA|uniref:AAA family ATPase n=1 Tax=Sedimentitalea arenosa TaxID=2798803 RepID=A0A8J7J6Z7_9RHOB|nr:AAA family ATPase [Arenibacterium arenosum]MBJ6372515.1 AAA family ATPase [Arenibacterium arenosum]